METALLLSDSLLDGARLTFKRKLTVVGLKEWLPTRSPRMPLTTSSYQRKAKGLEYKFCSTLFLGHTHTPTQALDAENSCACVE